MDGDDKHVSLDEGHSSASDEDAKAVEVRADRRPALLRMS